MKVTNVRIANGSIVGELREPEKSNQLIVICHGYQSSQKSPTIIALSSLLSNLGHATFSFSFARSKDGIDAAGQVRDLLQIINHFKDYGEIVLVAHSFAALSASIATIHSTRVSRLVTIGGFFGRSALGREYRRKFRLFKLAAIFRPGPRTLYRYLKHELRPEYISVPVLVIHSHADKRVYFSQSQYFYNHLQTPKEFLVLETADHGLTDDLNRRTVVDAINAWLAKPAPHQL